MNNPFLNIVGVSGLPPENTQGAILQSTDVGNAKDNENEVIDLEKGGISSSDHHEGSIKTDAYSKDEVIGIVDDAESLERGKSFCLIKNVRTPVVNLSATPPPSTNHTNLRSTPTNIRSAPVSENHKQSPQYGRNTDSAPVAVTSYVSDNYQQKHQMQQLSVPSSSQQYLPLVHVATAGTLPSTPQDSYKYIPSLTPSESHVLHGYTNNIQASEAPNNAFTTAPLQQYDQTNNGKLSFKTRLPTNVESQHDVASDYRGTLPSSQSPMVQDYSNYHLDTSVRRNSGAYVSPYNNSVPQRPVQPSFLDNRMLAHLHKIATHMHSSSLNNPPPVAFTTSHRSCPPETHAQQNSPGPSEANYCYPQTEPVPHFNQTERLQDERNDGAASSYRQTSDYGMEKVEAVEHITSEPHIASPLNDSKEELEIPRHEVYGSESDIKQNDRSPLHKEKGSLSEPAKQILNGNRNSIGDTKDGVISIPRNNSPVMDDKNIADLPSTQLTVSSTQEEEFSDEDLSIPLGDCQVPKQEKRKLQKPELRRNESPSSKRKRQRSVFDSEIDVDDKEENGGPNDPSAYPSQRSSGRRKNGKEKQTSTQQTGKRKKPGIKKQMDLEKKPLPTCKIGGTKLLKKPVQTKSASCGKSRNIRRDSRIENNGVDDNIRRSTRLTEKKEVKQRKVSRDLDKDSDDDDFELSSQKCSRVKPTTRKPRKTPTKASPAKRGKKTNALSQITGPNEESRETEVEECNPSQEPANDEIVLNFGAIRPRKKKKQTSLYPESVRKKMSSDELTTIRLAFVKFYPPPPSNMQAQGRYERMYGGEMPPAVIRGLWLKELKPWSDRWWSFYTDFNEIVRAKKLEKPPDKNPTITEAEAMRWAKEFHKEHGEARILAKDLPK